MPSIGGFPRTGCFILGRDGTTGLAHFQSCSRVGARAFRQIPNLRDLIKMFLYIKVFAKDFTRVRYFGEAFMGLYFD